MWTVSTSNWPISSLSPGRDLILTSLCLILPRDERRYNHPGSAFLWFRPSTTMGTRTAQTNRLQRWCEPSQSRRFTRHVILPSHPSLSSQLLAQKRPIKRSRPAPS
ncbi:hypothetical protein CSPX01_06577 [Colletotrichum filicis]|nr:hypothetical protein CSPX01_06577 [Colletotrichum filicis]